jgi:hypothetical protein
MHGLGANLGPNLIWSEVSSAFRAAPIIHCGTVLAASASCAKDQLLSVRTDVILDMIS